MSAADLLDQASQAGLTLRLVDGRVRLKGPQELVSRWAPVLRPHRVELAAYLADAIEWQEERAGILEHEAGHNRNDAEQQAARMHRRWVTLDRVYQEHHWTCRTCIAASQGRGLRCGVGASLWRAYSAASGSCHE